jgi:hypothetical protein
MRKEDEMLFFKYGEGSIFVLFRKGLLPLPG